MRNFALYLLVISLLSNSVFAQEEPLVKYEGFYSADGIGKEFEFGEGSFSDSENTGCGSASIVGSGNQSNYSVSIATTSVGDCDSSRASNSFYIWVKGGATVRRTTQLDYVVSAGASNSYARCYPKLEGPTTFAAPGAGTFSYSQTSSSVTSASCGFTSYRLLYSYFSPYNYPISCSSITGSGGFAAADGELNISIEFPNDEPVAVIDGPYVGGVLTPKPARGSSVTVKDASYDPDDADNIGGPDEGMCGRTWQVTKPDQSVVTSTSSSFSFSTPLPGLYTVLLTVTDNEGSTSQSTKTLDIDGYSDKPGSGPEEDLNRCVSCGDPKTTACLSSTGNGQSKWTDPTATRGYPLRNEITVNTQSTLPGRTTVFGNAEFTYGMEVVESNVDGVPHRFLVIGDGTLLDFGVAASSPVSPAGVYSTLAVVTGGYELQNAGDPLSPWSAGNFTYIFDSDGKLTEIEDPEGNLQILSYNGSDDLEEVLDQSSDRTLIFEYDTPGVVARIVENGGIAITHFSYTSNRLTQIALKNGSGTLVRKLDMTYNVDGTLASITRDGNSASTITYSYTDSTTGQKLANLNWSNGSTGWNYFGTPPSGTARRISETNGKGGTTHYDFSRAGDLIRITRPKLNGGSISPVTTYTYDSDHNRLTESNGTNTWTYTYDSLGQLASLTDQASGSWAYTYSGSDLLTIADSTGTLWTLDYTDTNNPHRVTTATNALGNTWSFTYNSFGQPLTVTPPIGSPTGVETYTYEENTISPNYGYLASITNGAGDVIDGLTYTSMGDLTSYTTHPTGGVTNTTNFTYDAAQRMTELEHPDGKTQFFNYTGGDLTSTIDEAGTQVDMGYCATCGKMTSWDGPLSKALDWTHDGDHDLINFSDGRQKNTVFAWGTARELKSWTYADNQDIQLSYDNYGRFRRLTNGRSQSQSYSFNAAARVTGVDFSPSAETDIAITWNSDSTINQTTDASGTTAYVYKANKLIESVTYTYSGLTPVQKLEYTYNPDDTLASMTWKSGTTTVASWTYDYDGAGRLETVTNSFGEVTTYTYDGEGKILTQSNQNGTSIEYAWNHARGWPTEISHKLSGTPFAEYDLVYDSGANTVGNLTGVTELSGDTMAYGYDALYRLTSETRTGSGAYTETLGYDLAGNITTRNGSAYGVYDDGNRLVSLTGTTCNRDNDGNNTTLNGGGLPALATLTWDSRSKMTKAVTSSVTYDYKYDAYGRRTHRTQSTGSPATRHFIYSGDTLIGEVHAGTPAVAYTWGSDGLVSQRLLTGTPHSLWYHFGPQGETRAITDGSGVVANTYLYNAYGRTLATTGTEPNPFRYGGKFGYYTDLPQTFMLAGARWYSPHAMRWLSRDPIYFRGGDNLHAYVMGNPVKYVDPDGLAPWQFHPYDHGGPHFQTLDQNNKPIRYRAEDFSPLRHLGDSPPELTKTKLKQLMKSPAYETWLKWRERTISCDLSPRIKPRVNGLLNIMMIAPEIIRYSKGEPPEWQTIDVERELLCRADPKACEVL